MELQNNLVSLQLDQRLSRAAWLQRRWLEVSERERGAHLHNRQLLQDFQRAQDAVDDMVARTAAMHTIQVEYEKYLEDHFPRWQQKLKDKRLLAQRKPGEQHLKDCIRRMEEDIVMEADSRPTYGATASPPPSPGPSNTSSSNPLLHTPTQPKDRGEVLAQVQRNYNAIEENNKRNIQGNYIQNGHPPPSFTQRPPTWLTQVDPRRPESRARQHFAPQQSNVSKETRGFQNPYRALSSPISPHYPPAGNTLYNPYSMVQWEQPALDHLREYPFPWAGVGRGVTPGARFPPAYSHGCLPVVNPLVWGLMSGPDGEGVWPRGVEREGEEGRESSGAQAENCQGKQHRKREKGSVQSSELDTQPVRLSSHHGDSSESSTVSSKAKRGHSSGERRKRTERRGGTQGQGLADSEEAISQGSSIVSQASPQVNSRAEAPPSSGSGGQSDTEGQRSKRSRGSPRRKTNPEVSKSSRVPSVIEMHAASVTSTEQEEEEEESSSQKEATSDANTEEKGEIEEEEEEEEGEGTEDGEKNQVQLGEESFSGGEVEGDELGSEEGSRGEGEEEKGTGTDEEEGGEEQGSEEVSGERDSDGEEMEGEGEEEKGTGTDEEEGGEEQGSEEVSGERDSDGEEMEGEGEEEGDHTQDHISEQEDGGEELSEEVLEESDTQGEQDEDMDGEFKEESEVSLSEEETQGKAHKSIYQKDEDRNEEEEEDVRAGQVGWTQVRVESGW